MKVVLINGSPNVKGNTYLALKECAENLNQEGVETEIVSIGSKMVRGCIGCDKCRELKKCVFDDDVANSLALKTKEADGIIVGSPVYYAGPNGALCALLDRIFYSSSKDLRYKPAASICVCRRSGGSATIDRLNKYFTINQMPVVSSIYWNILHGNDIGDVLKDDEGMQTMRMLARNMALYLKNKPDFKELKTEKRQFTNFIR